MNEFGKKPRLENWEVGGDYWMQNPSMATLRGNVYNHPNPRNYDGKLVVTSWLMAMSYSKRTARTENTEYELGEPHPDFLKWLKDNNYDVSKYEFDLMASAANPGGSDEKNTPS